MAHATSRVSGGNIFSVRVGPRLPCSMAGSSPTLTIEGGVSTFGRSQHTNKILALKVVVVLDILYIKRQIYKGNTGEWRLDKIKQQLLKLAP